LDFVYKGIKQIYDLQIKTLKERYEKLKLKI